MLELIPDLLDGFTIDIPFSDLHIDLPPGTRVGIGLYVWNSIVGLVKGIMGDMAYQKKYDAASPSEKLEMEMRGLFR